MLLCEVIKPTLLGQFTAFKKFFTSFLKKELANDLHYHGIHHTLDVYEYVQEIAKAEKVSRGDLILLKLAVLLHDSGFTEIYTGHEDKSCDLARSLLPQFGYSSADIEKICGMILATKIPQKPTNLLEKIIADADLMYLGTMRFKEVGDTLFAEMKIYAGLHNENAWNLLQKKFLETHHYHTDYCRKKYEPAKQKNLQKILALIEKEH
jgi:uncharacterized protein